MKLPLGEAINLVGQNVIASMLSTVPEVARAVVEQGANTEAIARSFILMGFTRGVVLADGLIRAGYDPIAIVARLRNDMRDPGAYDMQRLAQNTDAMMKEAEEIYAAAHPAE